MLVLLIRIVFIGVKTGFVTELFKLFGVFCAVFTGLHYYTSLAVWTAKKTGLSLDLLQCLFFVLLVSITVLAVKYLRDGFLMIFKFETTHAGVDQWGSGILAVLRALFLISLILYGVLLSNIEWLQKQTYGSVSQKLALKVAPGTYNFWFNDFISKVFPQEKYNEEVTNVVSHNSVSHHRF